MFIKLQMQNHDDFSIVLNFDKVTKFYRCGEGRNSWTEVFAEDGETYSVTETVEEIRALLVEAGVPR